MIVVFFLFFIVCIFKCDETTFHVSFDSEGGIIPNAYSSIISWCYLNDWASNSVSTLPKNSLKTKYSYLEYVQLFTGTGGCYVGFESCTANLDLLVDMKDPSKGYNFDPLLKAISNVLNQGFLPHIVTGNVPISFSSSPHIGSFGVNTSPPSDYNLYFDYIQSLGKKLVSLFGLSTVQNFKFGVLTEFNNPDWYTSKEDYFQLYNTTTLALLSVLGDSLKIGSHACTECGNGWDALEFIDYVAEHNLHITFLSNSFYEKAPGNPGNLGEFNGYMQPLIQRVQQRGLQSKIQEYGIDEGRLLWGPPEGSQSTLSLVPREIGDSYQGSWDGYFFAKMLDNGVSYYSRWNVNSKGIFGENTVDTVASNVARLTKQMSGSKILHVNQTSTSITSKTQDGGGEMDYYIISGYKESSSTVYIFGFNHFSQLIGGNDVTFRLFVEDIPSQFTQAELSIYEVSDQHGNYWPSWWNTIQQNHITSTMSGWSIYSSDNYVMINQQGRDLFDSNLKLYQSMAAINPIKQETVSISSREVFLNVTMIPRSVFLAELNLK